MRKSLLVLLALTLCASAAIAEDGAWFDLEKCGVCKHLTATPGLLEAISWDNYVIDAGMMTIAVVPAEFADAYQKAEEGMHASGEKMMAGEEMHVCGMCMSLGQIFQSGKAHMENVQTKAGHVTLVTSSDAPTVAMIQAHAKRNIDEMKKMMAPSESR